MKKLMALLLLLIGGLLSADSIDVTYAEGTDQSIIASLTPRPASPEVDANATIEAVFTEALNPTSTLHSIALKRLTGKKKRWGFFGFGVSKAKDELVEGSTDYDPDTFTLRFTPKHPLRVGFYEVKIAHLLRMRPGPDMMVKDIRYRFYVPEVINGFKLPPVPDPKKNDETLLGIDFNRNGIRDDVERLIIIEESKNREFSKTHTAISLQYAWAWQKMIENPTIESRKYLEDASACKWYFFNKNTANIRGYRNRRKWRKDHSNILGVKLEDALFNTKERILRRFEFNQACSGHIFELKTPSLERCMINIDALGE